MTLFKKLRKKKFNKLDYIITKYDISPPNGYLTSDRIVRRLLKIYDMDSKCTSSDAYRLILDEIRLLYDDVRIYYDSLRCLNK